jgi:hypothetical protein
MKKSIFDMTRADLRKAFPRHGRGNPGRYTDFMGNEMILAMFKELAKNPIPIEKDPTLTSYWYLKIKEFYGRIGLITGTENGEQLSFIKNYTYDNLADLEEKGKFSYDDLNIRDRQRSYEIGDSINGHVIVFIEKETSYYIIKKLSETFGITALCGKGQPSYSLTKYISNRLKEMFAGRDLTLITFTDYDPSGLVISKAINKQLTNCWIEEGSVNYINAGLFPENFEDDSILQWYPVSGKEGNRDKWIEYLEENNHLINNDDILMGIELDSLDSDETYKIMNDFIVDNIDLLGMIETYKNEYIENVKDGVVENLMDNDSKCSDIKTQIEDLQEQLAEIKQEYEIKVNDYIELESFEFSFNLNENMLKDYFDDNKYEYEVTEEFEGEIEEDVSTLSEEMKE